MLSLLLSKDPPEHITLNETNGSLLLVASSNRKAKTVSLLLDRFLSVIDDADSTGDTPLLRAAANGYEDVVRILLDHGADAHKSKPDTKKTALMRAAENGHA